MNHLCSTKPTLAPGRTVSVGGPEEMMDLGQSFARDIPADSHVALSGNLGSGKTTFVKGMGRAYGISDPITSPTFNLMFFYQGNRMLIHVDAYRLRKTEDFEALLIEEWAKSPWVVVIEWPENIVPLPPCHWLDFKTTGEHLRQIHWREGHPPP